MAFERQAHRGVMQVALFAPGPSAEPAHEQEDEGIQLVRFHSVCHSLRGMLSRHGRGMVASWSRHGHGMVAAWSRHGRVFTSTCTGRDSSAIAG